MNKEIDRKSREALEGSIVMDLKHYDPVMYQVLKAIVNDEGFTFHAVKYPHPITLDSIYNYFTEIIKRISKNNKNTDERFQFFREGTKLYIFTQIPDTHYDRIELLKDLFNRYADKLNDITKNYIIHKIVSLDNYICLMFDVIDTSNFDFENDKELQEFLIPYIENMY